MINEVKDWVSHDLTSFFMLSNATNLDIALVQASSGWAVPLDLYIQQASACL